MIKSVAVPNEWFYASVDLSNDVTTITTVPCLIGAWEVTTVLSANACPIVDDTTTVLAIPASSAVGAFRELRRPIRTAKNLIVDPDNAATGVVTLSYRPLGIP
jgi:CRISPR/Cas system CSM-associated protein Csm3 (group 7 of RAMP superfamily)